MILKKLRKADKPKHIKSKNLFFLLIKTWVFSSPYLVAHILHNIISFTLILLQKPGHPETGFQTTNFEVDFEHILELLLLYDVQVGSLTIFSSSLNGDSALLGRATRCNSSIILRWLFIILSVVSFIFLFCTAFSCNLLHWKPVKLLRLVTVVFWARSCMV